MIQILWFVFLTSFVIQVWYIYTWLNKVSKVSYQDIILNSHKPEVSIVICAKNAINNLTVNLPSVLNQEYPKFEIILVDDGSTDGSGKYLKSLQEEYSFLKVISINQRDQHPGKKKALQKGVKEASYEWILLTDSDCTPASEHWISEMVAKINQHTSFVLGISPALKMKGFLNQLIRFDNLHTAIQYVNLAFSGRPYMGVGRNLLVRRELFFHPEYERHLDLSAGDDDLLVNQFCNKENTKVCLSSASFVFTDGKNKWMDYFRQKRRHYSVSHRYQQSDVSWLLGWSLSKVFFYSTAITLLFMSEFLIAIVTILVVHFLNILYLYRINTKVLENRELVHFSPVLDVISVFFNSFVLVSRLISRKVEWN